MISDRSTQRLCIRLFCLFTAVLLVSPIPLWISHSRMLVQASPFVFICTLIAGGALGLGSILGFVLFTAVIFKKRLFCSYICPVGLIIEFSSRIGMAKKSWWKKCPSLGSYLALITAAGAAAGYPVLLWMDPLVFFNSAFSFYNSPGAVFSLLSAAGLAVLILISLTSGALWCARICPLGGTQDFLGEIGTYLKNIKKGSQKKGFISQSGIYYSSPVTRRTLLAAAGGVLLGVLFKGHVSAQAGGVQLRPPGAVDENIFRGSCARCGNCMRACPEKIIQPDTGAAGITGFMAPVLNFNKSYCLETCNICTGVCPSGALEELDLEGKQRYNIGKAVLHPSLCYMVRGVNDCDICVRTCPYDAVQIYWDEENYVAFPFVELHKCNGCGACERFCPTGDVRAITVHKT